MTETERHTCRSIDKDTKGPREERTEVVMWRQTEIRAVEGQPLLAEGEGERNNGGIIGCCDWYTG